MSQYTPEKLVAISCYQKYFPTLSAEIQNDTYARISELLEEEKEYCDKGNHKHMSGIYANTFSASRHPLLRICSG